MKPAKRVKKQPKQPREQPPAFVPDWSFFLSHFSETAEQLLELLRACGRRVTVDKLMLVLHVRGDDAADTAIRYGQTCGVVYTAVGAVRSLVRVRKCAVSIVPLFQDGEAGANVQAAFSISVFSAFTLLFARGPGIMKLFLAFMRASREKAARRQTEPLNLQKDGVKA